MKEKILMIQLPHLYEGKERELFFPLGLGYIVKSLQNSGYNVEVFDIYAGKYKQEEVIKRLNQIIPKYGIVGISALSTQYKYVKWVTKIIRNINKEIKIVIGGALATLSPEIVLRHTDADICVIGEGEITIVELMENLRGNLSNVKGIFYKDGKGIVKNSPREYIKDIDTIDFPAWEAFDIEKYINEMKIYHYPELRTMNIITARGCPYSCNFCSKTFSGVRLRSVRNIIEEIKELKKRFNIQAIFFNDELVLINKKRGYELCKELRKLDIKWVCQGRVNTIDSELLNLMRKSGCVAVGFGIESGSQKILNAMNKQITVEQSVKAVKAAVKAGLFPIIQVMFGYPGEDITTVKETLSFFKKIPFIPSTGFQFSPTTPLPGTPLWEYAKEKGIIDDEEKFLMKLDVGYSAERILANFTKWDMETYEKVRNWMRRKVIVNSIIKNPHLALRKFMKYLHSPRWVMRFAIKASTRLI